MPAHQPGDGFRALVLVLAALWSKVRAMSPYRDNAYVSLATFHERRADLLRQLEVLEGELDSHAQTILPQYSGPSRWENWLNKWGWKLVRRNHRRNQFIESRDCPLPGPFRTHGCPCQLQPECGLPKGSRRVLG